MVDWIRRRVKNQKGPGSNPVTGIAEFTSVQHSRTRLCSVQHSRARQCLVLITGKRLPQKFSQRTINRDRHQSQNPAIILCDGRRSASLHPAPVSGQVLPLLAKARAKARAEATLQCFWTRHEVCVGLLGVHYDGCHEHRRDPEGGK